MPVSWVALPDTPGCFPPPKIWPFSPTPCSTAAILFFAPIRSKSLHDGNPSQTAPLALSLGYPIRALAIGKVSFVAFVRTPRYTGTSLWIDPERQLSIALLTNRTWPDCQNQAIKKVRPAFHDALVEALGKQS